MSGRLPDHVLVVDDEAQVLLALEDLLGDQFAVHAADSAEKALGLIEQEDFAVIITDQRMPRMNGDELLKRLEGRSRATRMLVTGFADLGAVTRAVNEGRIFAYVPKPWDPDDLVSKVQGAARQFRLAKELARERQLLLDLMDNIPDGIFFKDVDLRFLRANRPFSERLERPPEQLIGKTLEQLAGDGAEVAAVEQEERSLVAGGAPLLDVVRSYPRSGGHTWFSESKAPVRSATGEVVGIVGVSRDVTERMGHEKHIARLTSVRALLSGINAAIVRTRERERLLEECCRIAAVAGELALAVIAAVDPRTQQVQIVATEPQGAPIVRELEGLIAGGPHRSQLLVELFKRPDPVIINDIEAATFLTYRPLMLAHGLGSAVVIPLMCAGEIDAVFCLFSKERFFFDSDETLLLTEIADNISFALDHIGQTKRLKFLAYHDSLTRLPNRDLLLETLEQKLALPAYRDTGLAVLIADVGRFRHINETWGRRTGDALLVQLGERLSRLGPRIELCARLFGNTFALVVSNYDAETGLRALVEEEVLGSFQQPFELNGIEVLASARIGIALFPADGNSGEALLANAEAAAKKAKASGQAYVFYAPAMNARIAEQMALEAKLRRALARDEFLLYYQPKIDLKTGVLLGLEALIRWRDSAGALVPPGSFIPLLEETGLIREVGRWVMERAAQQHREWTQAGHRPPRIAVNVSALQLAAHDFVAQVENVLARHPGESPPIDLEITESVFVDDLDGSVAKLAAARRLGLGVSMDDFGTGYSSMSSLGRLPLDSLKIDRSFVMSMTEDPQSTSIVTTIISLAHALDLSVIAEGVETREQATLLRLLKCNQAQGYLFAKPLPAHEAATVLESQFDVK